MKNRCKTTFKDAGLEGAKEIQEIVEFLKNPEKYTQSWRCVKGLTCGTSWNQCIIEAVAGEAQVPFSLRF
jgi:cell division protease FtsH